MTLGFRRPRPPDDPAMRGRRDPNLAVADLVPEAVADVEALRLGAEADRVASHYEAHRVGASLGLIAPCAQQLDPLVLR